MKTITKRKYWEKITAYFSKDLTDSELDKIEEWADLQDGKELLMELKENIKHIDNSNYMFDNQTDSAWTKLNQRIEKEGKPVKNYFSLTPKLISIAAAVILLLGIGLTFILSTQDTTQQKELLTSQNQDQITLDDGTIVYLNGNSKLIYPEQFKGQLRTVKLVGEAYFDVQPDQDHPFVIETETAKIQVLGTSFNVRTFETKSNVEVLVTSGKVRLQDIVNPNKEVILEKGDFASLSDGMLQNNKQIDINYLSWQTKTLIFNQTPLEEVIQTLNRSYAVHIELEGKELGGLKLTSRYNQEDVDALIDAMCLTFDLSKKTVLDRIILSFKTIE